VGVECHQSWRFVGRHFQLYDTSPMMLNWPWAWPCWNCTRSYKFSVSVKKMGEGWTRGASDIEKDESSGEDPRETGGLVSNLPHPRVNKTKQCTKQSGRVPVPSFGCHFRSKINFATFQKRVIKIIKPAPALGHAAACKRRALAFYFSVRIC